MTLSEIEDILDDVDYHLDVLDNWQYDFVSSVRDQIDMGKTEFSDQQIYKLKEIRDKIAEANRR